MGAEAMAISMRDLDPQFAKSGRLAVLGGAAALMMLPVLPERFSGTVAWDPDDSCSSPSCWRAWASLMSWR